MAEIPPRRRPWHRLRIRAKMVLAFGAGAVLTMVAAGVAWLSYSRVEHQLTGIAGERLATLSQSMQVARDAAALAALAPTLVAANTTETFKQAQTRLTVQGQAFSASLNDLRSHGQATGADLERVGQQLITNLDALDRTLAERLQLNQALKADLKHFIASNDRLHLIVQPLVNAVLVTTSYDTRRMLDTLPPSQRQQPRDQALMAAMHIQYERLQMILELKADSTQLAGLINMVPNVTDIDVLPTLENDAGDALTRIRYRIETLPAEGPRQALLLLVKDLDALVFGADNLFKRQQRSLEARHRAEQLLADNRQLAASLDALARTRLSQEQARISQAANDAERAMRDARLMLLLLTLTGLAGAVLLAGLFAGPLLAGRLRALSANLRAIAAGRLDTIIEVSGEDEIGELAEGLRQFSAAVAERERAEAELARLANYDSLTGLPNRNLLSDRAHQALAASSRQDQMCALLFIDLDRFKLINDTQGHEIGDQVLSLVAIRLSQCLRASDTVGRLGGDEFAIIARELANVHDIAHLAQKVLNALTTPLDVAGRSYFVGASIGISLSPTDGDDYSTLLRKADTAMYIAKDAGGGRFQFFSEEMNRRAEARFALENRLRAALVDNQFELWYQPKAELSSGRIIGVEALIRWQEPGHGYHSPADFIPVAEQSTLIEDIGAWVLMEACRQCMAWRKAGYPEISVAVNISTRQLANPKRLRHDIGAALNASGLPPQLLELEVTEGAMLMDMQESILLLEDLKQQGHVIAIDDFGTGYSSLSYIRHLPINVLKIDKSFVDGVITDPTDAAVASAIIALGRSLKLITIAEGVENAAQKAFLAERGCDCMQGYHLSKPRPYSELVMGFLPGYVSPALP